MRPIPLFAALMTAGLASQAHAAPTFHSTDPAGVSHWQVSTVVRRDGSGDGQLASFSTASFSAAVAVSGRPNWIANIATGSNSTGGVGQWTFFVFRQTLDLTGYDPAGTALSFQWAADDSGQGFAARGTWLPKFRLNGGALVNGDWSGRGGDTYGYDKVMTVTGFQPGLNTLDFYVEGNGITDGMSLRTVSLATVPVPEPETYALMLAGLGILGSVARRRRA